MIPIQKARCRRPHALITLLAIAHTLASVSNAARGSEGILWGVKWSPDGTQFAVGGEGALWIVDTTTFERRSILPHWTPPSTNKDSALILTITDIDWHPVENLLALSSQDFAYNGIYDVATGKQLTKATIPDHFGRGVSWHPDGHQVAFAMDGRLIIASKDGTILQDIPRYKEGKGLTDVVWSPDGSRIVTVGARITWHDSHGSPLKQVIHRPEVAERQQLLLSAAWHPSGSFVAVGDYGTEVDDAVLQFWSTEGTLIKSQALEGDGEVRNLAWTRDGSRLATASSYLTIWDRQGERLFTADPGEMLWGVDWSPDGETILTSSGNGRVDLWSPEGKPIRRILAPTEEIPGSESN